VQPVFKINDDRGLIRQELPNAEPRAVESGCYGSTMSISVRADSTISGCIRSLPLAVLYQLHFQIEFAVIKLGF